MSWLKEKIFGSKPRIGSCTLESDGQLGSSSAQYCQNQLQNFISKGQKLKTFIIGYEHVSEVRVILLRKNTSSIRSLYRPWDKIT